MTPLTPLTHWEYCWVFVSVQSHPAGTPNDVHVSTDGRPFVARPSRGVSVSATTDLIDILNEKGREGWDVIHFSAPPTRITGVTAYEVLLKRLKP